MNNELAMRTLAYLITHYKEHDETIINSEEIQEALSESINKIVFQIKNVLEETPPELSADILDKGIILTGGGSMITGLDKLLSDELKVPVFLADSPLTCVVE